MKSLIVYGILLVGLQGAAHGQDSGHTFNHVCAKSPPPSAAFVVAVIDGPSHSILPDRCAVIIHAPGLKYGCDPHGALDPLGPSLYWAVLPLTIGLPDEKCVPGEMLVGKYLATTAHSVGHGKFILLGEVQSSVR